MFWCAASEPAELLQEQAAISPPFQKKQEGHLHCRGTGREPCDYAGAAGATIAPGPAQDSRYRCWIYPGNLDLSSSTVSNWLRTKNRWDDRGRLASEEGILSVFRWRCRGCGAARSQEPEMQGKTIVVVLPDSGERYSE